MQRTNEIKDIMRKLRDSKDELEVKNESLNEEVSTENDSSESDLILARLEDILSRFEKVIAMAGVSEEEPAEEETEEEPVEEEPAEEETEEEPAEEETAEESLEQRIANLERRFTESRRRALRSRLHR